MEYKCKNPIYDMVGNLLFRKSETYAVSMESKGRIRLKDETGCFRWFPTSGNDSKFFKENFETIKEKKANE